MENSDLSRGEDSLCVEKECTIMERFKQAKVEWVIEKFKSKTYAEAMAVGELPYEIERFFGNMMLNEGIQAFEDLICDLATITKWDNTNARLGVGDSAADESEAQTGLLGSNQTFKAMISGSYPSRSAQTLTWRSEFTDAEGNFAWNEFTVDNGAAAQQNLNRKVQASGTKSGGTWTLTLNITFS